MAGWTGYGDNGWKAGHKAEVDKAGRDGQGDSRHLGGKSRIIR